MTKCNDVHLPARRHVAIINPITSILKLSSSENSNNWELWIPFIRERCWRTLIRGECGAKVFWLIGTKMSVSKRSRRALKICPQPTQDPTSNRDCLENSVPGERLTFCQDSLLFSTKLANPWRIHIFPWPKFDRKTIYQLSIKISAYIFLFWYQLVGLIKSKHYWISNHIGSMSMHYFSKMLIFRCFSFLSAFNTFPVFQCIH